MTSSLPLATFMASYKYTAHTLVSVIWRNLPIQYCTSSEITVAQRYEVCQTLFNSYDHICITSLWRMVASGGGTIQRFLNVNIKWYFCSHTFMGAKWECARYGCAILGFHCMCERKMFHVGYTSSFCGLALKAFFHVQSWFELWTDLCIFSCTTVLDIMFDSKCFLVKVLVAKEALQTFPSVCDSKLTMVNMKLQIL